jgi:hypothetical protein
LIAAGNLGEVSYKHRPKELGPSNVEKQHPILRLFNCFVIIQRAARKVCDTNATDEKHCREEREGS